MLKVSRLCSCLQALKVAFAMHRVSSIRQQLTVGPLHTEVSWPVAQSWRTMLTNHNSERHMKYLGIIIAVVVLSGCATSKQITGPNGKPAHSIRCGAAVADACLEKAGEVCPRGYVLLNSRDSQYLGQYGSSSASGAWRPGGGSMSASATSMPLVTPNTMLVECKD